MLCVARQVPLVFFLGSGLLEFPLVARGRGLRADCHYLLLNLFLGFVAVAFYTLVLKISAMQVIMLG